MTATRTYPLALVGAKIPLGLVPISWETGGIGVVKVPKMPFRYKVTKFVTGVAVVLAGSNAATATLKKGSTELAATSHNASAAVGNEVEDTSVADHFVNTDEQLTITTAKSTAGGSGFAMLEVEVLPSAAE